MAGAAGLPPVLRVLARATKLRQTVAMLERDARAGSDAMAWAGLWKTCFLWALTPPFSRHACSQAPFLSAPQTCYARQCQGAFVLMVRACACVQKRD